MIFLKHLCGRKIIKKMLRLKTIGMRKTENFKYQLGKIVP